MSTCTVRPNMNYYLTIKVGLEGKSLTSTNCLIATLPVQYSQVLDWALSRMIPHKHP